MTLMKPPYTYQINHIQLADDIALPVAGTGESGWYLVFWWKQIPVGQLFIQPGETLSNAEVWQKVVSVIQGFMEATSKKSADAIVPQKPVELDTPVVLRHKLNLLLARYNAEILPAQVPVSVIICTRNRAAQLQRCLQSLRALPCQPAEIVVVDNAPTDNSTQQVVEQFSGVLYCREPKAGLDIARNTGVRKAQSPVVAYVDDDVLVHPHWVYQVWQTFTDPQVEAMTGLVVASELQTEAQLIFETHWSFNRGYVDKYYNSAYFNRRLTSGPPVWEIGAGANMAFRKDLFNKVGYFDERLDVGAAGCSGDSEMWFRILAHGGTIHYNPRAVTYHEHRQELSALKKQLFNYMRGHTVAALIQQQHRKAGYTRHVFRNLPTYYVWLLMTGFPAFRFRYQTLGVEMNGIFSGLLFYFNNRQRPPQQPVQ